jgi:acyl carrier protein
VFWRTLANFEPVCGLLRSGRYNMSARINGENVRLDTLDDVRRLLKASLQLGERADRLTENSPLLGAIPELDSMAVVTLITAMEDQYGIAVDDDEISADTFASVGTLSRFLAGKLGQ